MFGAEGADQRLPDAVRRVQTLHKRALEHLEERGLRTLHLGCGLATWQQEGTTATPSAPVVLCALDVRPVGGAQRDFELQLSDEPEINPTLLHVLRQQFNVTVDTAEASGDTGVASAATAPPASVTDRAAVWRWLEHRAQDVPGFAIDERLVVGNFSYAKLPMVVDMENALDQLAAHDLIAALAGDESAQEAVRQSDRAVDVAVDMPDHMPPADEFLILDADASQQYAINSVVAGRNLIVRGPPGTGKSQTISNLVATLVARGRSVLFVAEKRAAIDAVLKRLDQRGLGNVVFDLHSETGSRRKLAERLADALHDVRSSTLPDHAIAHERLVHARDNLKAHDAALHRAREPWGISLYEAQAEAIALPASAASDVRFTREQLQALDGTTAARVATQLERLCDLGGTTLAESSRPWAGAPITTRDQARRALDLTRAVSSQLPRALDAFSACCAESGLPAPATLADWPERLQLWVDVQSLGDSASPDLYGADLDALAAGLAKGRSPLGRAFSGAYKRARDETRPFVGGEVDDRRLLETVQAAAAQKTAWEAVGGSSQPKAPARLGEAATAYEAVADTVRELEELSATTGMLTLPTEELAHRIRSLDEDQTTLTALPELHTLRTELEAQGAGALLALVVQRRSTGEEAQAAFRFAWLMSLIEEIRFSDSHVATFSAQAAETSLREFRRRDREHIDSTTERVRRAYAERVTAARDAHPSQAALIEREARKKRRLLPLRRLVEQAPDALVALKPCWAMSPLLVSQILPADMRFDVVVFDEASQVTQADAIPSIMRGTKVVVAGDERQLPPTAFFTSAAEEEDWEGDDESVVEMARGFESILDALGALIPFRMLEWHYRSLDERLIAFSNAHVYDRALTTFPGIGGEPPIHHVLVDAPATVASGDSSAHEVERVVDLVLEHATARPDESLGVIALGIKHANRVEEALRAALAGRRDIDEFFDEEREERFFVKNLERVQGDEREAIILTAGYAKGPDGRLRHHFGPINMQGGERRLNVAVTRARRRMTLVSSFAASDIDPNRSSARGVALLRQYLQFADSRGDYLGDHAPEHPPLNAFEVDVRNALSAEGIPLTPQLGASGYYIDFAAGHPDRPGDFVLAIECDGAAYHSAPTARDRDRLRQEQLERLGWRFHRIWSTDWFNNRPAAVAAAVAAWREAVADAERRQPRVGRPERPVETPPRPEVTRTPEVSGAVAERRDPCPVDPGRSIVEYSQSELRAVVRWVESDTRLRTQDELLAEVVRALGFKRRGSRIVDAIERAIRAERGGAR